MKVFSSRTKRGRVDIISAIIGIIIIFVIAVFSYSYLSGYMDSVTAKNIRIVDSYESEGKVNIVIANTGTKPISLSPCEGSGKTITCGDLTIIKTSGEGDLDLEIEQDVIEPGESAVIKDKGASGRSSYKILSTSTAVDTEVNVQEMALPEAEEGEPPVTEGLIAYYKFNGNAYDEIGNHNGTLMNGAEIINDETRGQVASFDGIDDYVITEEEAWLPTGNMAVSVWVYAKGWGEQNLGRILAQHDSQRFYLDGKGDTRLTFSSSDGAKKAHSAQNMVINEWKHLVVNRIGNNIYFYIDAVESDGGDPDGGTPITRDEVYIGSDPSQEKVFDGYIDELMLFDRALTEQEILDLYNWVEPKPVDSCQVLTETNRVYVLNQNIENNTLTSPCINIAAPNIRLDCQNHYILSDDNHAGIYSNQSNTTIKNCNISMGTSGYGIELNNADNSTILNNTLNSQETGLYLISTDYSTIEDNTVNYNNDIGIHLESSSNNQITNNIANSNTYEGIWIDSSSNNQITNNIVNSNKYDGIFLYSSSYNTLRNNNMSNNSANFFIEGEVDAHFNNIIDTTNIVDYSYKIYYNYSISDYTFDSTTAPNAGTVVCAKCDNVIYRDMNLSHDNYYGLYFFNTSNSKIENIITNSNYHSGIWLDSSSNNIIQDNTANSNSRFGIYLGSSSKNNLTNIITDSNGYGILLSRSSNNNLTNITVKSHLRHGIYLQSSSNNHIYDFKIWNCSAREGYHYSGILLSESSNNIFERGYVNKIGGRGIRFHSYNGPGSFNNLFKDMWINDTDAADVYFHASHVGAICLNNTFLNVSFDPSDVGFINNIGPTELIRKWYYRAYVNDTNGNDVSNANVAAYNVSGDYQFNLTTGSNGYTEIYNIIEHINNKGTKTYYSPYTIYASKDGYVTTNHTYDANENNLKDVFTLS